MKQEVETPGVTDLDDECVIDVLSSMAPINTELPRGSRRRRPETRQDSAAKWRYERLGVLL